MWSAGRPLALLGKARTPSLQATRTKWWRKIIHNVYPSMQERLAEMDQTRSDPELHAPVNIGLSKGSPPRLEQIKSRLDCIAEIRKNKMIEKEARKGELKIDLDKVQAEWEGGAGPHHHRVLAQHYGIFTHLFGNAYFVPRVSLNIAYDYDENSVSPVYRGNTIKPKEASSAPNVQYHSEPNTLWTLILTNPDGNLMDNDLECLHWFVGNIKESDISTGEVMCDYLQPFPPRGTGYHRMVFVLYKQHGRIDFSKYKREQPCLSLSERNFSTLDMYRELQDVLTPAGLSWFQSDWDSSLTDLFHNTLNMREPVYEYDFPKPYLAPQKLFPHRRQFNTYMDRHRDPKQVSKEILLERLKKLHPFGPEAPPLPFPAAQPIHPDLTSWERRDVKRRRIGLGKYQDLFRGSNRPA
ncbi:39S ribosomal protein L38, mitochondrial-like [Eriocheir sinensis]|uniref:39S ribosomal protein L38, mitochondrial-like n=1 Tax=Eriocheir sinensis TaxID=95602 RepID=UPI0021CA28A3|nr:39S ribosomal protein L38, mitochondrial-like [Eriocheir sinensis]